MGIVVILIISLFIASAIFAVIVHFLPFTLSKNAKRILSTSLYLISVVLLLMWDNTRIETGRYYVNLFPINSESKNYRVPADIENVEGDLYIVKAYFPNGGYITFHNYFGVTPLKVGKKLHIEDDKNEEWYIELTKEKAKKDEP